VLLIKQCERNSNQLNFNLNQINVIIYSYQHRTKKYLYLGCFKFYQPKATGGGFLIFEWTSPFKNQKTIVVQITHIFHDISYYLSQ
jgi:hypothetical protein